MFVQREQIHRELNVETIVRQRSVDGKRYCTARVAMSTISLTFNSVQRALQVL